MEEKRPIDVLRALLEKLDTVEDRQQGAESLAAVVAALKAYRIVVGYEATGDPPEKGHLTNDKYTGRFEYVKVNSTKKGTGDTMTGLIELDFSHAHSIEIPISDAESIWAHECKACGHRFKSRTGSRNQCPSCNTRMWRGYSAWEAKRREKSQSDKEDDSS